MGGFAAWLLGREAYARSLAKTPPIPPTAILNTQAERVLIIPPLCLILAVVRVLMIPPPYQILATHMPPQTHTIDCIACKNISKLESF